MASVMCLHFNMQEEDILEHTMASFICVYFSQLINHYVT